MLYTTTLLNFLIAGISSKICLSRSSRYMIISFENCNFISPFTIFVLLISSSLLISLTTASSIILSKSAEPRSSSLVPDFNF